MLPGHARVLSHVVLSQPDGARLAVLPSSLVFPSSHLSPFAAFPTCFCETAFPNKRHGNALLSLSLQIVLRNSLRQGCFSRMCAQHYPSPLHGPPGNSSPGVSMVGGGHMSPSFHLGSMLEASLFSEKLTSHPHSGHQEAHSSVLAHL